MTITGCMSDVLGDGELTVTIPRGLVGFGDATCFALAKDTENSDFFWLRSVDKPGLAFLLINPYLVFPDYEIEVSAADALSLVSSRPEDLALFTTVTPTDVEREVTVNLLAPIALNVKTLVALQLVPQDCGYSEKHPLPRVKVCEVPPARLVA